MAGFADKRFVLFLVKFILGFCLLYYGTIALIGLSIPGNHYSPFIEKYVGYYRWLRDSLITSSRLLLSWFGYATELRLPNYLKITGGRGATIGYDCLGYGVISFWVAFIFANNDNWKKKLLWMIGGSFGLWLINVLRISIILVALNKRWAMPFGWNHHTWFNIVAYMFIFTMIWWYDKRHRGQNPGNPRPQGGGNAHTVDVKSD